MQWTTKPKKEAPYSYWVPRFALLPKKLHGGRTVWLSIYWSRYRKVPNFAAGTWSYQYTFSVGSMADAAAVEAVGINTGGVRRR